jgi:hypothetical protein
MGHGSIWRGLARAGTAGAAAALIAAAAGAQAQDRPERIGGEPNLNGVWQAMNSAHWNLEAHSAEQLEDFWQLGAVGAIPAGLSVVEGGEIPYLPAAVAQRDANGAGWPMDDPEAKCYLPGVPRAVYMDHAFQIVQGGDGTDILMVHEYAATNRVIHVEEHNEPPIDTWMGLSNGTWEGDTLVVVTTGFNGMSWLDRAGNYAGPGARITERFTPIDASHMQYEATIENPAVFSAPWTISMPLYRRIEPNAQILEFKCVPFSEMMLYGDLKPEDVE